MSVQPAAQSTAVAIQSLLCLEVSVLDVVAQLVIGAQPFPSAAAAPRIKFVVVDCRPMQQFVSGHLPVAFHLDPELVRHIIIEASLYLL